MSIGNHIGKWLAASVKMHCQLRLRMGPNKPRRPLLLSGANLCILIRELGKVGRWKHKHNQCCLVHVGHVVG